MGQARERVAVVTGVTSGIGEALARKLAAGWKVIGVGRGAERVAAAARAGGFHGVVADLAEREQRTRAVAEILALAGGRVDALVNNAAECVYESPTALDDDAWLHLMQVNLLAAVQLTAGLKPRLEGGRIVNVSSIVTRFLAAPRFGPYAVSKAALEEWTRALRLELAAQRTGVTLVAPGLVDTPIYDKVSGFDGARQKLREQVPMWLGAGDVADAVVWALEQPPHVVVSELALVPRGQAR
jgi:NAD(P)-dependent dehydrogenase (short-subunit alcohol dehydrogenase family)